MLIFPAIDLYKGKAVRLYKGDYAQMTVYSDDPVSVARDFYEAGAEWVHTVDLEGALDGTTPNLDTVCAIAKCGLRVEVGGGIRTLDGLDAQIQKFYREGFLTSSAISAQLERLSDADDRIAEVLAAAGQEISVTTRARDFYRTWTYAWEFTHDVILHAATLARTATQPMAYINKILADWKSKGLKTLEQCKSASAPSFAPATQNAPLHTHTYTAQQLNALIDDINEVEF